jgi:protein-disulfide isomerase
VRKRALVGGLAFVVWGLVQTPPVHAQQTPQSQTDDLRKEIESLREMLKQIQEDLQEIKASLPRRPRSAVNSVLDVSQSPFRGERTAPLTLVEYSDYQ